MDGVHFANRHNQSDGPMTGQTRVRSTYKSRYLIFRQSVCCLFPICWSRNCLWIVFLSRTIFFNLLRNARSRRRRVENSTRTLQDVIAHNEDSIMTDWSWSVVLMILSCCCAVVWASQRGKNVFFHQKSMQGRINSDNETHKGPSQTIKVVSKTRFRDFHLEMALDGEPNCPPGGLWRFRKSKPFIKNNSGCPEQP